MGGGGLACWRRWNPYWKNPAQPVSPLSSSQGRFCRRDVSAWGRKSLFTKRDSWDRWEILGGVYMRKFALARVSFPDDFLILHPVYMMTASFHISLFEGIFHVNKIYVWFKITTITHALPIPVHQQTYFPPKSLVVSHLHDNVARFPTRVKFSPRCNNRGELTPGWLVLAWHFVVVLCK